MMVMEAVTGQQDIEAFFRSPAFGVVGASNDRGKYGNKVLRRYLQSHLKAYPVNPNEQTVEGLPCLASVGDLPSEVKSISVITQPSVTEQIVDEAIAKGIKNIWMQPGAESPAAVRECQANGINVIADGSCVMVLLAQRR